LSSLPEDLNLPAHFTQLISDRNTIDHYQIEHHRVEPGVIPSPDKALTVRNREGRFVRVIHSQNSEEVLKYRFALSNKFIPLRGFRAPILERAGEHPLARLPSSGLSESERRATACVRRSLARDGLLSTLAQLVQILGPAQFLTNGPAGLDRLRAAGFPADLLGCFPFNEHGGEKAPYALVAHVARKLSEGATPESLKPEFDAVLFHFLPARPDFQVATESGEHELGMIRMQVGGGYLNGIVPGDNIDVVGQIAAAVPKADFLLSVAEQNLESFAWLAAHTWRLRRTGQVTLVGEALPVGAWAQDNGKPGILNGRQPGQRSLATLIPRFASMDEGQSTFDPGESFLMDGLQAAGQTVIHSALLFQGGNLLPVRDPKSGERILLLSEGELYRNMALGLTRAQVLEALRIEFGVDRCVPLPAVSYHLDFDLCFRAHGGKLVAFVNDTVSAVRAVLGLGIAALEHHGALDTNSAQTIRADLAANRGLAALRSLTNVVQQQIQNRSEFPAALSKFFVAGKMDSAAGNLQCFLLALDILESAVTPGDLASLPAERRDYLRALQRLDVARRNQAEALRRMGCKVVPIPSMSDLGSSINYGNGIHHREGYIMPVFGGFYAPLDQAAIAAFHRALGPDLKITPIYTAESQRAHGGVHCTAAVYPLLDPKRP
jgi:hypothetical protein